MLNLVVWPVVRFRMTRVNILLPKYLPSMQILLVMVTWDIIISKSGNLNQYLYLNQVSLLHGDVLVHILDDVDPAVHGVHLRFFWSHLDLG